MKRKGRKTKHEKIENLEEELSEKDDEIDRLKKVVENRQQKTEKLTKKVSGTIINLNGKLMGLSFRGKVLDEKLIENGFDAAKILEIDQTLNENLDKKMTQTKKVMR